MVKYYNLGQGSVFGAKLKTEIVAVIKAYASIKCGFSFYKSFLTLAMSWQKCIGHIAFFFLPSSPSSLSLCLSCVQSKCVLR